MVATADKFEMDWTAAPNTSAAPIVVKHDFEMDWTKTDDATDTDAGDTVRMPAVTLAAPLQPPIKLDAVVSVASEKLCADEAAIAREHGFSHDAGALFYAPGTALAESGLSKAREYAAEYARLPDVATAAAAHAAVIAAEHRKDQPITLAEWRVGPTGLLHNLTQPSLVASLSDTAWSQIGNHQAEIDARNTAALSAPRGNVNAWIGKVDGTDKARVRGPKESRQIYAVVSNGRRGYTAYDSDRLLYDLARALPGTKCKVRYTASNTKLVADAYIQAPIHIDAFIGVGRVHQAGIRVMTRDDGMMSLTATMQIVRIRCLNHTLTAESRGTVRRKHTGSYAELYASLGQLVGTMPELIASLKSLWGRAATEHYLDSETGLALSAPLAIERLVLLGQLPTAGLDPQAAIDAYVSAWRAEESPNSAAGVVMAVQRASHEFTSTDGKWRASKWADDTEAAATSLLYQPVYTLDQPIA